jgi:cellulose synthase/poly-beta-1,6-N-acetylglucosamine synthase-like glycosyltransferase
VKDFWQLSDTGTAAVGLDLFWLAVALLFYIYVGYPLLLAIVATFARRSRPQLGEYPKLSVLIAAYNEEANIGRKIRETLALDYPADQLEIMIVSDGSIDRTDEIVKASAADTRVRFLRIEDRRGKTHAQNEGVKHCNGDIIVFSDATAVYHPKALQYLACNYKEPEVGAVSGRYQYFDPEGKFPTGLGSVVFWNYENMIKKLQSRIRTLTGCSGCIYSVRRTVYTPLPDSACSDLVEPLHVVKLGYRVVFEDRALAHEETTKSAGEEFGMRVRVVTRGIRGVLSVSDLLKFWKYGWVSFQLISHKMLRWCVPFVVLLLLVANVLLVGEPLFRYLLILQLLFYFVASISLVIPLHRRWKLLGMPLYFCTLNAAALFGIVELVRGHKYVVWETVRK